MKAEISGTVKPCEKTGTFTKRIGSTVYHVDIHFSRTSRETMDAKIIRMVRNEAAKKAVNQ
jgi:hypothetical protein